MVSKVNAESLAGEDKLCSWKELLVIHVEGRQMQSAMRMDSDIVTSQSTSVPPWLLHSCVMCLCR